MEGLRIKNIKENNTLIIEADKHYKTGEVIQMLEKEGEYWTLEIIIPNNNNDNGIYSIQYKDPRIRVGLERKINERVEKHPKPKMMSGERTTKRIAALITTNKTEKEVFYEFRKYGVLEYIKMIPARRPGYKVALVKYLFLENHEKAMREAIYQHREGKEGKTWEARTQMIHARCGNLVSKEMYYYHRKYCKLQSNINTKWDLKPKSKITDDEGDDTDDESKLVIDEGWDVVKEMDELEKMLNVRYCS